MDFKYWCAIGLGCSVSYAVITLVFLSIYAQKEVDENHPEGFYTISSSVINLVSLLFWVRYFLQYFINDTDHFRIRSWFLVSIVMSILNVCLMAAFFLYVGQYYEISTPLYILLLIPTHAILGILAIYILVHVFAYLILISKCLWRLCGCRLKTQTPEVPTNKTTQPPLTTAEQQV